MEQLDIELGPSAATVYQQQYLVYEGRMGGKVNINIFLAGQSVLGSAVLYERWLVDVRPPRI